MVITNIDLYEIDAPAIPPVAKYRPLYNLLICRIQTDEGIEGIGELHGRPDTLEKEVAELTGQDPLALDPLAQADPFACALMDIAGKAYGISVHRFFGEKVRDRVPVSYWSCPMPPHETAAEAEVGAKLGFSTHKLKARPDTIVETVRLMKEAAGPDYAVGIDPNMKFRYPHVAAKLAEELEPFGIVANLENPIWKYHLDWYRLLRETTTIPIAMHLNEPGLVLAALKAECCDQFNRDMDVLGGSLVVEEGHFLVPEGPGLGVELDMEVVERFRVG